MNRWAASARRVAALRKAEADSLFAPEPDLLTLIASRAHADDPDTSHAAAAKGKEVRGGGRRRVLEALATHGPATADELIELAHVEGEYNARRRVSELKTEGMVEDTGERRDSANGSPMMVVAITPYGRHALASATTKGRT